MTTEKGARDKKGRFAQGHPGGPGRPRRLVEQEYLAALNSAVSLEKWREIVDRALDDAILGDARAREWLSQYLLGEDRVSLVQIAAKERAGLGAEAEITSATIKEVMTNLALDQDDYRVSLIKGMLGAYAKTELSNPGPAQPAGG